MKKGLCSYLLVPLVEKFIANSKSGKRLQLTGKRLSVGTIENYHYLLKHLNGFEKNKGIQIRLKVFNKLNQTTLLVEKNYWKRFYRNFLNYLYQQKIFDNYAGMLIKILRTVFRYIEEEMLISVGPFYKSFHVPKEEIQIITLSPERLRFLINDDLFNSSLTKEQKLIKDIFILGCTVALRFSDLIKIRAQDISHFDGKHYLSVTAIKTGKITKVQLPEYAISIINCYQSKSQRSIFPGISLWWFNKSLQGLFEVANWTEIIGRYRSVRGKAIKILQPDRKKEFRFCDSVSSHLMRRTAITTMLMNGVPQLVVKKISGHAGDSKSFYRYVDLAQSFMDTEVTRHFEKLISG